MEKEHILKSILNEYLKWAQRFTSEFLLDYAGGNKAVNEYELGPRLIFIWDILVHKWTDSVKLAVIKRFLNNQTYKRDKKRYFVEFWDGQPYRANVQVDNLNEIDFEDSYTILNYKTIYLYNKNNRAWKEENINKVIQHIKEDLMFDGDRVIIKRVKSNINNTLKLDVKIMDSIGKD